MTPITFWFDPISPYAHLAFERLPQALEGCSYAVSYRPLLFAGLLKHWGQLGPAEIPPKRDWTFRQVAWIAQRDGIVLDAPAAHPFNPLPLLRLLYACGAADDALPNRWQCETVLRHVWRGGLPADDAGRLAALAATLKPARDPATDAVKQAVRAATDAGIARGVFGVPTVELPPARPGGAPRMFWGVDGLGMAAACLHGDPWFDRHWDVAAALAEGPGRKRKT